jgi:hypothetical protein
MQKVVFKLKSMRVLVDFISQFEKMDVGVPIEITPKEIQIRCDTQSRTILKVSTIPFDQVFEIVSGEFGDLLKIPVFSTKKFLMSLDRLSKEDGDIQMTVEYQLFSGANVATWFRFSGKHVVVSNQCGTLKAVDRRPPRHMVENLMNPVDSKYGFPLTSEHLGNIQKLCKLIDAEDVIDITSTETEIVFESPSFRYAFDHQENLKWYGTVPVKRIGFTYIGDDDYRVVVSENAIVIKGQSRAVDTQILIPTVD